MDVMGLLSSFALINYHNILLFLQVPKKLPKVNRKLAASVIEKEAEIEQIEADKNETKKASKKKKGLGPEIFEDERFKALFEDKVLL